MSYYSLCKTLKCFRSFSSTNGIKLKDNKELTWHERELSASELSSRTVYENDFNANTTIQAGISAVTNQHVLVIEVFSRREKKYIKEIYLRNNYNNPMKLELRSLIK